MDSSTTGPTCARRSGRGTRPLPTLGLALALGSAAIHATWNLLLARSTTPEATAFVTVAAATVIFAPAAVATWDVSARAWPFIAASGALELVYWALLAAAYRRAELSVVYPLARGTAPVLVLLVGVVALGASTSASQAAGVCLVGAGILLVRGLRLHADWTGVLFGLGIAGCIAGYTLVDKHGVEHANPIPYLELVLVIMTVGYGGALIARRGVAVVRPALNWTGVLAGLGMGGGYVLVLYALRLAPAASVAVVRETGVVLAVALARVVLKERVTLGRLGGAVLVAGGVALVSL